MVEDAALSSQSLILDAEKFGHLQILANSIYDKKKLAPEPETPRQDSDNIRWIDDKSSSLTTSTSKKTWDQSRWIFQRQIKTSCRWGFNFSLLDESPYFCHSIPRLVIRLVKVQIQHLRVQNQDLQTLKQKLEILLGEQFSNYFNNLDPNISFEIESVKQISPEVYSVSLSLVKMLLTEIQLPKLNLIKSLSLIVHKQQDNIPELAKTPEVSNTSWAKQYSPDQPLANSTTMTLEFKNPIQTDASGQPTSQWLIFSAGEYSSGWTSFESAAAGDSSWVEESRIWRSSLSHMYTLMEKDESEINRKRIVPQPKLERHLKLKLKNPELITSSPVLIPNPQHQLVQLTLNPLLNQSVVDFKISDLKVESPTKLSFSLESSDIKRLINAPIEIAKTSADSSAGSSATGDKNTTNIVKIKPKLVLQGAIGVPWSTIKNPLSSQKHLNLNDKWFEDLIPSWSKKDTDTLKAQVFPKLGKMVVPPQSMVIPSVVEPILMTHFWRLLEKTLLKIFLLYHLKVFDPSGYLNQRLAHEGEAKTPTTNLNLYSYQLNKTKEENVRKGWTNVHPNQFVSPGENFRLTNDYLNIILNQPTKVTYYSASDFVNNLFNDPDKKILILKTNTQKLSKKKVGANAVDWGTAYLNFWYPKELIQQQSNIISANLTDLLFVNPDELDNNKKMIAPNLVNWWPNFRNSETPFIRTTENTDAKNKVLQNPLGWTQVQDGGFGFWVRKTLFNRDTRTFTLTTNIPVPTQDYSTVKDTDDWRFVFQNDSGQIAMLKATRLTKEKNEKDPAFKDNGAVQFQTVIPEHFFTSSVRFVGIFKQEDQKLQWLPIADTEFIIDDRYFKNITSDTLDFRNANARGLTNNAFGEIFKEFNIHKPRK
ncbi:hypothetical protein RNM28_01495 [Mesomycoplasma ovipneumoniae]|uniref:hypothetical protein n=1 Tax=Mesomycoplasma ovipneumoniae TaxID=29562 RepID=UPI0028AF7B44|nr:hypothetical protein [Mesomycoplasma ovipneumoniae]WNM17595.1 hypothetical protein RNM28_01495 [Mesomycoplasma ovipneumoniae]